MSSNLHVSNDSEIFGKDLLTPLGTYVKPQLQNFEYVAVVHTEVCFKRL